ncbi:MAG: hypothetical protein JNL83_03395 [Myxococcales bacterium]|nr:hypothetical protein [Myxococcales bacterium]
MTLALAAGQHDEVAARVRGVPATELDHGEGAGARVVPVTRLGARVDPVTRLAGARVVPVTRLAGAVAPASPRSDA